MAVKIRLSRRGRKKLAIFDIIIADARSPRDGKIIEKIGIKRVISTIPFLPVRRKNGREAGKKDVRVGRKKRLIRPPTPPDTPTQAPTPGTNRRNAKQI